MGYADNRQAEKAQEETKIDILSILVIGLIAYLVVSLIVMSFKRRV